MSARIMLRAAWRGALVTLIVAMITAVLVAGGAAAMGFRPVVVLTGSMGSTAPPGALAIAGPTPVVEVGDILVMRDTGRATVTHRIVDLEHDADGQLLAVTRGDANPDIDPVPYEVGSEDLTVRWVVPGAGRILMSVRSPALGLSLVGFVVTAFLLTTLRRIWLPRGRRSTPIAPKPPIALKPKSPGEHPRRAQFAIAIATAVGASTASGGVVLSLYTGVSDVTGNEFSTLACYDSRLDDVQTGQLTTSADGVTAVPIGAVDPTSAFLLFSASSSNSEPDESLVMGRLASSTSIEFVRASDGAPPGDVVIEWSVVEYACGITVQRGTAVGTGTSQIDVPITPVNAAASFVTASSTPVAGSTIYDADHLVAVELVGADTLRLSAGGVIPSGTAHSWQVITFDNDAEVLTQVVSASLMAGSATATATLPAAVDLQSTFVLASVTSGNGGPTVGDRMVRARLVDESTIEITRQVTTGTVDVSIQVVELRDGSTVRHGVLDLNASTSTATATFPPVMIARSTALSTVLAPTGTSGGSTDITAGAVIGEASARLTMLDTRTVEVRRDTATADASFAWQVITWGGPGWADLQSPFRRRIDVTAGAVVTPDGYTTPLTIDHAAMVTAELSLADGSDLRIWRNDGTSWTELDRVLDQDSSWDAAATTVWFRTQEPIAADTTISYWLYFGNPSPATPLDEPANVWLVAEGFDDGTLGAFEDRTGGTGWYRALPWTRRIALSIDPNAVGVNLTDEVVLVQLTDSDLGANAQSDGSDIRFTAADGVTALAHELEAFDAGSGAVTAWVRVPSISATVPTVVYLLYGASDAPAQAEARVTWADAAAVWQLANDPAAPAPALDDGSPFQRDGVALADASLVTTPTGPAIALDGSLDRLESAPFTLPDGPLTISAWFTADTLSADAVLVAQGDPTNSGTFELAVDTAGTPTLRFRLQLDGTTVEIAGGTVTTGDWHLATATWSGADLALYLDGVPVATTPDSGSILAGGPTSVVIGADPTGSRAVDGTIGHVKLDAEALGPIRVAFRAANLLDPSGVVVASSPVAGTWFDQGDWTVRRPLVVDADQVSGTLTDYPLLVQLTDGDIAADAQADGDDLVFTAADGVTRLDHQIEAWNPGTGELTAWVRLPVLSDAADTTIYLYLANPTAVDQHDPIAVWGPDADLVALG